ncbi:MAG: HAD-IIIA family hydrolase [Caulobacteraceae bacterium]|nr:HAD-IIIA family hydrolase [Caulobacter sp.]
MTQPPRRGAVFFDRDGVLNIDIRFAHRPDQITWVRGAAAAVRRVNAAGLWAFVVTNQSGVERGLYTDDDVRALHRWMAARLAEQGARIDAWEFCPHHGPCRRRKPEAGMLEDLIARHDVDRSASLMIGDRDSDMAAAAAASVRGVLFTGADLGDDVDAALAAALAALGRDAGRGAPP